MTRQHFLELMAEIIEVSVPRNIWTLERRGIQENQLFKDSLLQPEGQFIPTKRKSGKNKPGDPSKSETTKKGSMQMVEAGMDVAGRM